MNFNIVILLYAVSGMIANVFYIPQIFLYIKQPKSRATISLLTWGGWMFCGIIAFIYATVEVQKIEMILVTGFNAVAQIFVFGLGALHRIKHPEGVKEFRATFLQKPVVDEGNYLTDNDSVKLLIVMITRFSRVCRRFERRYFSGKGRM